MYIGNVTYSPSLNTNQLSLFYGIRSYWLVSFPSLNIFMFYLVNGVFLFPRKEYLYLHSSPQKERFYQKRGNSS